MLDNQNLELTLTAHAPLQETRGEALHLPFRSVVLRRLRRDKVTTVAGMVLLGIALACVAAPLIAQYDPLKGNIAQRLVAPGEHGRLLGTDEQGRDMLTRLLYGGRLSLLAGVLPVLIGAGIGAALGIVAGFFGGATNATIMRTMDVFYAFPAILLAIGIAAALGAGLMNLVISISIVLIPPVSRVAETAVRQVRSQQYIEAARASGSSRMSIIVHQVLPNMFAPIFVYASSLIGISIISAAGLSYLGLGIAQPTPEWGAMLNTLKDSVYTHPIVVAIPGALIFIVSISFNLISDGIRDALDARPSS
jgi:peptide/nickel transport system permease protein